MRATRWQESLLQVSERSKQVTHVVPLQEASPTPVESGKPRIHVTSGDGSLKYELIPPAPTCPTRQANPIYLPRNIRISILLCLFTQGEREGGWSGREKTARESRDEKKENRRKKTQPCLARVQEP